LAGSYILNGYFETDKGTVSVEGKLYIGEKQGIETDEHVSGLIIREKEITKMNIGNMPEIVTIKEKKDILSRLFVSTNIDPDTKERDGIFVVYTWSKNLNPGDKLEVTIKTNYILPLIVVLIAAIAVYFVRKRTETDVEVIKSVNHMRTKGGEFALKVRIKVRAKKAVEKVSLIDRIPAILKLYEHHLGTIKPRIDVSNRRMQWDIGSMGAGEERSVEYIVYSKVGIVGKFSLPEALAVFEHTGFVHEVESNKVFFLSEQVKTDDYSI